MLLPIGDEPNDPKRIAWMNYALIGVNILVFLLMLLRSGNEQQYAELYLRWAYIPADGRIETIFTSMFMHGGWMHLLGNMLFLWIFGDNVEARLGPFGYLVSYVALGVFATLVFSASVPGSTMPLIGASGAISGVQGLYWIACPQHKVKLFVWLFVIFVWVLRINARWVMAFWFFMNDMLPVIVGRGPTGDKVAHLAHLAGFAGGLVLMLVLRPLLPSVQDAEHAELGRSTRYSGGHVKKYERKRRGDPYGPRP